MELTKYVALLRGINVGGKNIIKMDALRACLEDSGLTNVRTYIASGNVLFESQHDLLYVESVVDKSLKAKFGYIGPTVIVSEADFKTIISDAPKGFGTEPNKFHSDVIFLKHPFKANEVLQDVVALNVRAGVDTACAGSKALYFTRVSAERTKSRMSKITELPSYKSMTIRSWNTAIKLLALLDVDR
jgi:uncharacterized protein (DUF1697 family)